MERIIHRLPVIIWLGAFLPTAAVLRAQFNPPHLAYVYPAGGARGTTFQVTVGGQFLAGTASAYLSGSGVHAAVIQHSRPMTQMQARGLREKLQELQKQPVGPAARQQILEIRKKLATFDRNISPVLAETVTLQVTVAPDAAAGRRELRLATPQGLSNPLAFHVGQIPEFSEKQSDARILVPGVNQDEIGAAESEMTVTLPVTINGRIVPRAARARQLRPGQPFTPGDSDRFRFQARKGQEVVAAVVARELVPYLADAVPGWFQPALALLDDTGGELAYADHDRFHPDPVLRCRIPRDGEYVVEIRDALYRGREDFVYRITLTAGTELSRDRKGAAEERDKPRLPVTREKEPNESLRKAQKIRLPVVISGRLDRPGDQDVFAFKGRAGDRIVAEVSARRLDSPLDSVLRLTDAKGRQVAFNDDQEDKGSGLLTHHADSVLAATLPAGGTYYLHLTDLLRNGGSEFTYRLRVSPPRPDFDLIVTPSAVNTAGGMTVPVTVHAVRRDGFTGEIALSLQDAPKGVTLSGGAVPEGQEQVRVTLTVSPQGPPRGEPLNIVLAGHARIQGREVARRAVPADDMMQAFAYRHLVPAGELKLAVARRNVFRTLPRVSCEQPVRIPAGGSVRIEVQTQSPPNNVIEQFSYELSDPPEGITVKQDTSLVLSCDAAKMKPGMKGNLIVNILGERPAPPAARPAARNLRRLPLGTLPAIRFEVVPR